MIDGNSTLPINTLIGNVLFPCLLRSHGEHPSNHIAWLDAALPSKEDIMRNTTKKRGLFIATVALLSSVMSTPAAHADTAHAEVDSSTIVLGDVNANATVKTLQALGLQINGKSVARYVKNPAKHWNPKKAKKVPFAKSYWAGVRSGKPFRLHKGQKFPDTYIGMAADMTEHDVAVKNRVKHKWQLFDFKNGQVRNRGFWTGKKWVGDCVNPKPSGPPTVTIDQLHVVKQFNGFKVNITGSLSLWATTSGMVEVDCGSSRASARYSATAEAELEGTVTIKAKSRAQALVKGAQALEAKYRKSEEATLKLKESAAINLEGSAEASCESNEPTPTYDAPSVSVTPVACVNPGQLRDATVTVHNPNGVADTAQVTYRGQVYTKSVAANSQVTFTFPNQGQGTYPGTALLVTANRSASFTVTVEACPPPADTPPSMTCTGMQHVFVGEDRSAFDFDATDPNGDPISFGEPIISGPIRVVTVERTGNRLTVWIVAQDIPVGTSQAASVRVVATAGGKTVGCTVNTTVENNRTGW